VVEAPTFCHRGSTECSISSRGAIEPCRETMEAEGSGRMVGWVPSEGRGWRWDGSRVQKRREGEREGPEQRGAHLEVGREAAQRPRAQLLLLDNFLGRHLAGEK